MWSVTRHSDYTTGQYCETLNLGFTALKKTVEDPWR